jgi:hypothetical protein
MDDGRIIVALEIGGMRFAIPLYGLPMSQKVLWYSRFATRNPSKVRLNFGL